MFFLMLFNIKLRKQRFKIKFFIAGILLLKRSLYRGISVIRNLIYPKTKKFKVGTRMLTFINSSLIDPGILTFPVNDDMYWQFMAKTVSWYLSW